MQIIGIVRHILLPNLDILFEIPGACSKTGSKLVLPIRVTLAVITKYSKYLLGS
jgi:hypothetical protein